MTQKIFEPVSVSLVFDSKTHTVFPRSMMWRGRLYAISKVGLHYTYSQGSFLFHVFSVVSKTLCFRLVLNSQNLHWQLEEVSDGLPS